MTDCKEIYEETYYAYSPKVRGYLYNNVVNREEADDMFQDIFFHLWQALPKFRFDAPPQSLLYIIMKRRLIDFLRKKYRHAKSLIPASPDSELDEASLESTFAMDIDPLDILLQLTSGETRNLLLAIKKTRRRINNA